MARQQYTRRAAREGGGAEGAAQSLADVDGAGVEINSTAIAVCGFVSAATTTQAATAVTTVRLIVRLVLLRLSVCHCLSYSPLRCLYLQVQLSHLHPPLSSSAQPHVQADPASTPSSSASPTPQPASSPSRSPMVARPYIEDELSLDDSPVIVELRRRNSSADGGRDDPLARYGDRMIVKERERERGEEGQTGTVGRADTVVKPTVMSHNPFYPGHLIISNYQLAFIPTHVITPSSAVSASSFSPFHANPGPLLPVVQLPLLAISRLSSATIEQKDLAVVELRCKDYRRLHVLFTGLTRKNRWYGYQQCCDAAQVLCTAAGGRMGLLVCLRSSFEVRKQPRRG